MHVHMHAYRSMSKILHTHREKIYVGFDVH